jgi:DNA-binding beta-propeller fold protein YncE
MTRKEQLMEPHNSNHPWRIRLIVMVVLAASVGVVEAIRASVTGTPASAVLGEAVFDTNYFNTGSSMLNPAQITIDSAGHLYMADLGDNRVLGWHSASGFANNAPADVVIGQVDFLHVYRNQGAGVATLSSLNSPQGVATDSDGNLYVADTLNNRVTEYTSPFASFTGTPLAGQSASLVITATNLGLGESQNFNEPLGVTVDGNNNLFVAEFGNSRILEYLDPLATGVTCTPHADGSGCAGDTTVDSVLGQTSLTSTGCDNSGLSASTLCGPYGMAIDAGTNNLYVADMENNRVLVFPAPISTGESAAEVWGQPDFLSDVGGVGADLFEFPDGVALDGSHNLYVADTRNGRVLEYAAGAPYPAILPSTSWASTTLPTSLTLAPAAVSVSSARRWCRPTSKASGSRSTTWAAST